MSGIDPFFFFFNDTATTEIYTLSLHDALPICKAIVARPQTLRTEHDLLPTHDGAIDVRFADSRCRLQRGQDRKSTRLNSSHSQISYAVFCLKKKKKQYHEHQPYLSFIHYIITH